MTASDLHDLATKWFHASPDQLPERERSTLRAVLRRQHVARAPSVSEPATFGNRMADKVAEFGGSWTFIGLFTAFLIIWAAFNALVLRDRAFDPYPFIFLNLVLSMVAALQAPIIMMSQNRQAKKDRASAEHDYEVNLKAEIEIMGLHEKLDAMRGDQITRLLEYQQEQINILTAILKRDRMA